MIGAVSGSAATAYAAHTTRTTTEEPMTADRSRFRQEGGVVVDLSPAGTLITELPPLTFDPKVHMANAQKRLNELMNELGIPGDTEIEIKMTSGGNFSIPHDNVKQSGTVEKLAQLEQMLNDGSERELRNSLIGAHTGAVLQRIAEASQKTSAKVDADPQNADALWMDLVAEAGRIKNSSVAFSFSGGVLSGMFADETSIAVA